MENGISKGNDGINGGGIAVWSGVDLEARLGIEFCVYMLAREEAGLEAGAVSSVQHQAQEAVDDIVVEFESGKLWAIQAKAGSVSLSWKKDSPFGSAIRQLFSGVASGQILTDNGEIGRVVLAVDDRAPSTINDFSDWLSKSRQHSNWPGFIRSCTSRKEKKYLEGLNELLEGEPGYESDEMKLSFLKSLMIRRIRPEGEWLQDLRSIIIRSSIVDESSVERLIKVLCARAVEAAGKRGRITLRELADYCAKSGYPIRPAFSSTSYIVLEEPTRETIEAAIEKSPVHPAFVGRPELDRFASDDSEESLLIVGRKGSGKSRSLARVARIDIPTVIVLSTFESADIENIIERTRILRKRHEGMYQLIWDDLHGNPEQFGMLVERLRRRGDSVRFLCACRKEKKADLDSKIENKFGTRFWKGAGIRQIEMQDLTKAQAIEIAKSVAELFGLEMKEGAIEGFAHLLVTGDSGPLFAVVAAKLMMTRSGNIILAGEIGRLADVLKEKRKRMDQGGREQKDETSSKDDSKKTDKESPQTVEEEIDDLIRAWELLYNEIKGHDSANGLLSTFRMLYDVQCPLYKNLCRSIFKDVLEGREAEYSSALAILNDFWIKDENDSAVYKMHDVSLEAIPGDSRLQEQLEDYVRKPKDRNELHLGLLRAHLSIHYYSIASKANDRMALENSTIKSCEFGEMAVNDFRGLKTISHLGTALANTSVSLSKLASIDPTRDGRANHLGKSIAYIEESITIRRDLGLKADLAVSLNNASNRYSELASIDPTMDGRANHLDKAIAYIEESTTIRRDLGLKADLGISLGTANLCFRSKSYVSGNPEDKALFLRAAADCSEEAAQIFREIGQARFLLQAVLDAVINLRMLWELGIAEPDRIAALCKEGSQLAEQMEEKEAMAFFARLGNPIKS